MRRYLTATAVLTAALATTLHAQKSEDFHWTGAVAAGKTLRIMNVNGSIRATGGTGKDVVVAAVKKGRHSDPSSVEIRVEQDADGTTICAVWPSQDGSGCNTGSHNHGHHNNDHDDVNVDFTIQVPEGVLLEAETVNGSVAASGLTANAEVTTVNGDASLATRGTGSAQTVNGDVSLTMGTAAWIGELEAKTVNGSVTVEMPKPANLEVIANTQNGSISSDFPLLLQGKMSPRSIRGTIGNGGPKLDLSTVNGEIRLKQVS